MYRRDPPLAFASGLVACADARRTNVVKVCGVASVDDAKMIGRIAKTELSSDVDMFLGMIVWPKSKRSVTTTTAREIARVARTHGMRPVAVFVDESSYEIEHACKSIQVDVAQLHGPKTRAAVLEKPLSSGLHIIDVMDVGSSIEHKRVNEPLYRLCDTPGGGTGTKFDWNNFDVPSYPWLLAGGLSPDNVAEAIRTLQPTGVDVSSGVTKGDKVKKDEDKVTNFFKQFMTARMTAGFKLL